MGMVLKHVERTKAGSWQYRRRVPKEVASVITKREFKRKLGDSEKAALAAYPRYHAEVEREIAEAKRRLAGAAAASSSEASDRAAYAEALRRRADLIERGATEEDLALEADSRADSFPQDHFEPIGVPPVERHTINLLRLGPKRYPAPAATLEDAKRLYLEERAKSGEAEEALARFAGQVERIVGHVRAALGSDPVLVDLTRDDARRVRDYMLSRFKDNGEKISPASVARDMNGLKAVINFAATELPLPATFQNPFNKLTLGTVRGRASDGEKRDPLPATVLRKVRERIMGHAKADLGLIWRILEGTGCRLAEVTGLRVEDVATGGEFPHIKVTWHENRRLKTEASRRSVPLVGDALEAAKDALKLPRQGNLLFPAYASERGADAASASLIKHLRTVTKDPKHVVHSLRHNMKDALILAEVATLEQNLILGHALGSVGDRVYGGEVAKLRQTTKAMKKALGVDLSEVDKQHPGEE
ncbi:site-specific integrase [Rhodobacter capsulatus]|uniref:site-specific integrase n=1 Tax=Rhodobacter capsulatus TaxID=1061 RepID=UPI0003D2E116|nr:site-specific integrase [Rhodobacter capsulatus]ETD82256.1 hypothetical protein U716_10100 [Rhodobacter capsulatus B6]